MSIVKEQIEAGLALTSTIQGVLSILKGVVFDRFNFWLQRMADVQMTDIEKVKLIAEDYLGVKLTPEQCASVKGILGLQSVVTSYIDIGLINDFERAILLNPQGMTTTIKTFTIAARKNIDMAVIKEWKDKATNEKYTKEEKVQALVAFGIPQNEAVRCQWSGKQVFFLDGNPVEFYGLAGIDANTLLPFGEG